MGNQPRSQGHKVSFSYTERVNKNRDECLWKEVEIKQKTIFSLKRLRKVVNMPWIWLIAKKDQDPMG